MAAAGRSARGERLIAQIIREQTKRAETQKRAPISMAPVTGQIWDVADTGTFQPGTAEHHWTPALPPTIQNLNLHVGMPDTEVSKNRTTIAGHDYENGGDGSQLDTFYSK